MTPGASSSSSSMSPARSSSKVTKVCLAACAMVASSRRRPTQTLPASSAQCARESAMSGAIARTYRIGSSVAANGFCKTFQSSRPSRSSLPRITTQRHKRHAFLACLQRRVHRRAGRVAHHDLALLRRFAEARREARFAERNRARLDFAHAASADQQIGTQAEHGNAEELQVFLLLMNESPHDGHGRHRVIRGIARNAPSGTRDAKSSAAVRKSGRIVEGSDALRDVALQLLRRAQLLLAAGAALVDRHLELGLERRRALVGEVQRERLALLDFDSSSAPQLHTYFLKSMPFRFAWSAPPRFLSSWISQSMKSRSIGAAWPFAHCAAGMDTRA